MMIRKEKHIHQRIVVLVTRMEDEHKPVSYTHLCMLHSFSTQPAPSTTS